jgi:hypothetical protein
MESQSLASASASASAPSALAASALAAESSEASSEASAAASLPVAPLTSRLSTASLVLGLFSALCFAAPFVIGLRYGAKPPSWFFLVFPLTPLAVPWLPALLGIVAGHLSLRRMRQGTAAGGRWRALTGLGIGYCMLSINLVAAGLALVLLMALR